MVFLENAKPRLIDGLVSERIANKRRREGRTGGINSGGGGDESGGETGGRRAGNGEDGSKGVGTEAAEREREREAFMSKGGFILPRRLRNRLLAKVKCSSSLII